jgi:hypothetical protein
VLHTLPRPGSGLQTLLVTGRDLAPVPDPAIFASAVARYRALAGLRGFRQSLYECLKARADALFELADAVLCADHAVTSLVQLCLEPEFTRGHGALYDALYDALSAGRIDDERFLSLMASELPQAVDGPEALAWIAEHDVIDHGLLRRRWPGCPRTMPRRCGTRAPGGAGCGSPSMRPLTRDRTTGARRAGSTCTTAPATAGAPARPRPAGSTSSPRQSGTCAPRGPRSPTWRGHARDPHRADGRAGEERAAPPARRRARPEGRAAVRLRRRLQRRRPR